MATKISNNVTAAIILFVIASLGIGYYIGFNKAPKKEVIKEITKTETVYVKPTVPNSSKNIIVYSPYPQQEFSEKVMIVGEARTFENNVNFWLKDKNGKVIKEGNTTAVGGEIGQFNLFKGTLNFTVAEKTEATLEILQYSAKDGSVEDLVMIPVILLP